MAKKQATPATTVDVEQTSSISLGYSEDNVMSSDVSSDDEGGGSSVRTDYNLIAMGPVDVSGESIHVNVTHTICDRRAGTTAIEVIMGEKANLEVIAEHMKHEGVRDAVASFILERRIAKVMNNVIPANMFKPGESIIVRSRLLAELNSVITDPNVLGVMAEFSVALAHSAKILTESIEVTRAIKYATETVSTEALTQDLIAQNAVRTAENISVSFPNTERMSKEAFSEAFAEALIPVGYSLIATNDVQHLFDDIVKAILARLLLSDPAATVGMMEEKWMNHPVVQELSTNYVFVEAARSLATKMGNTNGPSIATKNSMFSLDRDAPLALASLKASRRFAITRADEYKATYGKVTLTDPTGAPCFFYGWRAGAMSGVAQNVCVFDDATMPGVAKNIVPGSPTADKFIQSAMPTGQAASINYHINKLATLRQHLLESRDPAYKAGVLIGQTFVFGDDGQSFSQELACLLADKVYLQRGDDGKLKWVYVVKTQWRNFYISEFHINLIGDLFYTTELGVALMMMDDFVPQRDVEPRAQLLSEKALYTRVTNLDESRLKSPRTRISFSIILGGTRYGGAIMPREVGLNDLPASAKFVVPVFNDQIAETINLIQHTTAELINQAENSMHEVDGTEVRFQSDAMIAFMRQAKVSSIVDLAREVSVQYRQTVDSLIKIKALDKLTTADAIQARGVLSQQQFMGYADLVALLLLFETNGLQSAFITDTLQSEALIPALLQQGSDRKQTK